jgi:hypothetical protein
MRHLLLAGCGLAGLLAAAPAAFGETAPASPLPSSCAVPYTFTAAGKTIPSGSCAGLIGFRPPRLVVRRGQRFSVRIVHEQDGRLDFPVPRPANTARVRVLRRHGSRVTYRARSRGRTPLLSRHTRFCHGIDPRLGTCTALKVRVVGRRHASRHASARHRRRHRTCGVRYGQLTHRGSALLILRHRGLSCRRVRKVGYRLLADGRLPRRIAGLTCRRIPVNAGGGAARCTARNPKRRVIYGFE